ncbi:GAF domain-containing protein [Devosia neptuniae]|uniref:GAF domain-containing protein n=2 Tax=Devosia TaxID=46913 RepID=UPI0022AE81F3|nr:GAF domain-containing protein [Devosia neptuniae]MCZ4344981.1 GAF domain-containing protein [Devosia neptuniae]|tara:strand:+ start:3468 stop:3959 length:492 start_codon:yes stop_codon:yes gene_type:complete
MTDYSAAIATFDAAISEAKGAEAAFKALQTLTEATVGTKLFTFMTVDMTAELARRAYTSDPTNYPGSGTKPIRYDSWFDIVHKQRRYFVANTIADIAKVFPDYELIDSLGCQSVVNMPVVIGGELIGTVNMLHEDGYYTPERVHLIRDVLAVPAKLAALVAAR